MKIFYKIDLDGDSYLFLKKSRVRESIKHKNFSECKLKVTYGKGITNSGDFKTKEAALLALSQWTEPMLLDHVRGF